MTEASPIAHIKKVITIATGESMVTRATNLLLPRTGAFTAEIMLLPPTMLVSWTTPSLLLQRWMYCITSTRCGSQDYHYALTERTCGLWLWDPTYLMACHSAHAWHACTTCGLEKADYQGAMDIGMSYGDFKAVEEWVEGRPPSPSSCRECGVLQ